MRLFSAKNFFLYVLYAYEPFPLRTLALTNIFLIRTLSGTNLFKRTSAYEPFPLRIFFITNFSIRTICMRTFSGKNLKHTNPIRCEPFPLRTSAVTNLMLYELYPIRTFAYELFPIRTFCLRTLVREALSPIDTKQCRQRQNRIPANPLDVHRNLVTG